MENDQETTKETEQLPDPIVTLTKDLETLTQDLKRVAADYENYRKRVEKERDTVKAAALRLAIEGFIPCIDNFGIALTHSSNHQEFVEGMTMIYEQFLQTLQRLGVEIIDPKDKPFNPEQHLAVDNIQSDVSPGTILSVVKKGYRVGQVVICPAQVKVAIPREKK